MALSNHIGEAINENVEKDSNLITGSEKEAIKTIKNHVAENNIDELSFDLDDITEEMTNIKDAATVLEEGNVFGDDGEILSKTQVTRINNLKSIEDNGIEPDLLKKATDVGIQRLKDALDGEKFDKPDVDGLSTFLEKNKGNPIFFGIKTNPNEMSSREKTNEEILFNSVTPLNYGYRIASTITQENEDGDKKPAFVLVAATGTGNTVANELESDGNGEFIANSHYYDKTTGKSE